MGGFNKTIQTDANEQQPKLNKRILMDPTKKRIGNLNAWVRGKLAVIMYALLNRTRCASHSFESRLDVWVCVWACVWTEFVWNESYSWAKNGEMLKTSLHTNTTNTTVTERIESTVNFDICTFHYIIRMHSVHLWTCTIHAHSKWLIVWFGFCSKPVFSVLPVSHFNLLPLLAESTLHTGCP